MLLTPQAQPNSPKYGKNHAALQPALLVLTSAEINKCGGFGTSTIRKFNALDLSSQNPPCIHLQAAVIACDMPGRGGVLLEW